MSTNRQTISIVPRRKRPATTKTPALKLDAESSRHSVNSALNYSENRDPGSVIEENEESSTDCVRSLYSTPDKKKRRIEGTIRLSHSGTRVPSPTLNMVAMRIKAVYCIITRIKQTDKKNKPTTPHDKNLQDKLHSSYYTDEKLLYHRTLNSKSKVILFK